MRPAALYRFKKIYPGENWNPDTRSPLTEPGVNVKEGDYLLAINGRPLRAPQTPDELLVNTANETTAITVNSKPTEDGARTVPVKPIDDEYPLREYNMVETNRKKVDAATHGRVGYIYIPDMGDAGLNAFVKQFFPQIRKEGHDHRRALQRRRLCRSAHLRAAAPHSGRHGCGAQL